MNIGFDLDKIFIDYPPIIPDAIIDRLYKKRSNGALSYRFPSHTEQWIRRLSHKPLFRPLIKENLAVLMDIAKSKNNLYLISSRFRFLKKETETLMKRLGFAKTFAALHFNFENKQPHLFKNEVLRKRNLDLYVDDDFPLLKFVAKHNKRTLFFWLNPKRKKEKLTRNITVIPRLSDLKEYYERT
jgi:hypothetical protein